MSSKEIPSQNIHACERLSGAASGMPYRISARRGHVPAPDAIKVQRRRLLGDLEASAAQHGPRDLRIKRTIKKRHPAKSTSHHSTFLSKSRRSCPESSNSFPGGVLWKVTLLYIFPEVSRKSQTQTEILGVERRARQRDRQAPFS